MKRIGKVFLWVIGIFLLIQIVAIALLFFARRIQPRTVLTVRLEGSIEEEAPRDMLTQMLTGAQPTVTDIVEALDRARSDPRITGIEVRVGESTMSMGKIQEIHQKLSLIHISEPTRPY